MGERMFLLGECYDSPIVMPVNVYKLISLYYMRVCCISICAVLHVILCMTITLNKYLYYYYCCYYYYYYYYYYCYYYH